jgi:peptidoglycan hydrolase-like protein with peptidoglycan-binding domain
MKKRILAGIISVLMMISVLLPGALAENLKYGSEGSQVTQAQSRLKQLGFYQAEVDGKFGFSTYLAVKGFQEKNGLTVDGVIGEITNLALFSPTAVNSAGGTAGTPTFQRIAYGSSGPAVKTVQGILRTLGYYNSDVEGKFGYSTYLAVLNYQRDNGLAVDGVVGPLTWASLTGAVPSPTPTGTVPPAPTPTPTAAILRIQYGDAGPIVLQVQQKLNDLGYYLDVLDSRFGWNTYVAVRNFQNTNGLKVDGIVGPLTWAKLFSPDALPKVSP